MTDIDIECIPNCRDCILRNIRQNGPLYISVLLALLLIACHFFFWSEKKVSLNNSIHDHPMKIVVFDLDETLGSFVEPGIFWESLERYYGHNLLPDHFYEFMDLFPEFIRPNILSILEYVQTKKEQHKCDKIMIYTNNQGPRSWVTMLSEYLGRKMAETSTSINRSTTSTSTNSTRTNSTSTNSTSTNSSTASPRLFDNIIAAFKIRGKTIELGRTSHEKSVDDLVRCTRVPSNTEICFIDDQFHSLMEHENVYYINVKPFWYSLPFSVMSERYYDLKAADLVGAGSKADFVKKMNEYTSMYKFSVMEKSDAEKKVDEIVGEKIMSHLEEFFAEKPVVKPHPKTIRKKVKRSKKGQTVKRAR